MKILAGALVLSTVIGATAGGARAEDATGTWIMESGKVTVRVAPCGGNLCGVIVAMKKPLDKSGKPKHDKDNPNPALRNRPVIGLRILSDMEPNGDGKWEGTIYNPDDGNTYNSDMRLVGAKLKVKGCVLFICKKIVFSRVN